MLKLISAIGCIILSSIVFAQNVNIPDSNFKNYLLGNTSINTNGDTEIQNSEAANVTSLTCSSLSIKDLTGIRSFTNLKTLNVSDNQLVSLDVSTLNNLTDLTCDKNQLTSLILSSNIGLLDCSYNKLKQLDLSSLSGANDLNVSFNEIKLLDVSACLYIYNLNAENNKIDSVKFHPLGHAILRNLALGFNEVNIKEIDFGKFPVLEFITLQSNKITELQLTGKTNHNRVNLNVNRNPLTRLNIDHPEIIFILSTEFTSISSLPTDSMTALSILACLSTKIDSLDLRNSALLSSIRVQSDSLVYMNIKNGSNTLISGPAFSVFNCANLYCVTVDDSLYSTNNWFGRDTQIVFSTDCSKIKRPTGGGSSGNGGKPIIVEEVLKTTKEFTLYPNPAKSSFNLLNVQIPVKLNISNILQQTVLRATVEPNEQVDISTLKQGLYFVSFEVEGRQSLLRLVVSD